MKYSLACDTWGNEELEAIQRVVDSRRFTMGKEVRAFEEEFADFFGVKYAKMTNSGSSANLLTMMTALYSPEYDMQPGDAVIVPTVSWSTTYFPVHQAGFKLLFSDISETSLNLCPNGVRQTINKYKDKYRIKAIFTVNLLGNASQLDELKTICEENEMYLFEDNCESLGASLGGKYCGTWGDMGTFSFFFSHHMQTMEGGMILTNSECSAQHIDSMRAHGWLRTLPMENHIHNKSGDPFEDSFRFVLPGYSVRPLEMSGATGRAQLKKWPKMMEGRRSNAKYFQEKFADLSQVAIQREIGESSWFGFSLLFNGKVTRDRAAEALMAGGVEIRPIVAGNFLRNPVVKHLDLATDPLKEWFRNADIAHDSGMFIGNDSVDITDKIDYAYDIIKGIVK